MTPKAFTRLQDFEAKRFKAYDDATGDELLRGDTLKGKLTIGIGRNLTDRGISYDEMMLMFRNDIQIAENEARANFAWFDGLDPVRQDFIVMMIFYIGTPTLKRANPKMLAAIKNRNWSTAGIELMDGDWHNDVGLNRANVMRHAIEFGEWV